MFTKREFTELVIEGLTGGAPTDARKYHPVVVAKFIDTAVNSIIANDIVKELSEGSNMIDPGWIKVINNIRIKYDDIRGQCYFKFPKNVMYMSDNKGVREIGWNYQDGSPTFRIMDPSSYQVISNLEVSKLDNGVFWALIEGERVYFPNMPKVYATDKRKVMAKVVCSFSAYDMDDEVPIPEERIVEVMDLVFKLMVGFKGTRQKVTNDSNPNTV